MDSDTNLGEGESDDYESEFYMEEEGYDDLYYSDIYEYLSELGDEEVSAIFNIFFRFTKKTSRKLSLFRPRETLAAAYDCSKILYDLRRYTSCKTCIAALTLISYRKSMSTS